MQYDILRRTAKCRTTFCMRRPTPLRRFADHCLGGAGSLDQLVEEQRGLGRSWEGIAREVWVRTDHVVEVSGQTLQQWYEGRRNGAA